ncbi:MAG: hypothetical protein ACJLS3_09055 [Erythrobacter sp.]
MKFLSSALAAGAALALSLPGEAAAQSITMPQDPASLDPEIIVKGERPLTPKEIGNAVDHLTRRTGLFAAIARFETPVCVLVIGLGERADEKIAARIRENVAAVGLQVAKSPKCRPNAIMIITNDMQGTFDSIYHKRQFLIGLPDLREYSLITLKAQLRDKKPAVSWSTLGFGALQNGALLAGQPQSAGFWGWNASRGAPLGGNLRDSAVLLVDFQRLNGVHVHQLADFATVHLLGSPRTATDPANAGVPTILSLFEEGPSKAPQRLTTFDRAYLCGLYRIRTRARNEVVNLASNARMKQNMLDVYDSECVRVGAPHLGAASAPGK